MAKYNISAGHNAPGKIACGAVGFLDESAEARRVCDRVYQIMQFYGQTVYHCTVNDAKGQQDCLRKICYKHSWHDVDLNISFHLNAAANPSANGVEVWGYDNGTKAVGEAICSEVSKDLGLRNRGFKISKDLYFLKHTKGDSILIECAFVTSPEDAEKWDVEKMAQAICRGIFSVYGG